MTSVNPNMPIREHEVEIRVRYQETDAQGRVHHANYINYFEIGRIELLRAFGRRYRDLEEEGILLVVTEMNCKYYLPADFDDLLLLKTTTVRSRGVRIEHEYRITRDQDLLAEGRSVVACIDRTGKLRRLPEWLVEPR